MYASYTQANPCKFICGLFKKKKKTYLEVSINRVPLSMNKTLGSIPSIGEIDNERIFT